MSAHQKFRKGIASSSTDAETSNKATTLAPSPALPAEQGSAQTLKNAPKDGSKEQNPVPEAAGMKQGKIFDPVRHTWH